MYFEKENNVLLREQLIKYGKVKKTTGSEPAKCLV